MRRVIALGFTAVLCGAAPLRPGARQQSNTELAAAIESFVSARVAADSFSGVVAVARQGSLVYQRAAGSADRDAQHAIKLDTKLQTASATKMFTQIAIWQLIQARQIALTDTVGKFLPHYPNETVRRNVTVEQLLRHRSGVGSFWNAEFMARRSSVRTVDDYLQLFQRDSLLFPPGTSEAYSNGGYVILGAIIERLSGKTYHAYLREHIIVPSGLTGTVPNDNRVQHTNAAIGYTTQPMGGGIARGGDSRLAGPGGTRPGYGTPTTGDSSSIVMRSPGDSTPPAAGGRLRLIGPDGREMTQEEARAARTSRAGAPRRPNSGMMGGMASPAGDYFTTTSDLLKLAAALTTHRLLDSAHTAAFLGARYASGNDYRANGGGPGVNAEFSIYPTGDVVAVLSNYDPPSATAVAEHIRGLLRGASKPAQSALRAEVDSLHAAMVAAFKQDPASVSRFYTDDAVIQGMGRRLKGRAQVDEYWRQFTSARDWSLEILEFGGTRDSPWLLGRSTLVSSSGMRQATDYAGVLERGADGKLRYRLDFYTRAVQ
ncbi:MAG TPA: serine hydrolase [Gemmatimonadaceae bacterium]|nr:serine hydrolase [Gemmatimonadaceae bacterium]